VTTRPEAIAAAAQVLAAARAERDQLAATGGPEAVGAAAWPANPAKAAEVAAKYRRWQDEERGKRDASAA
jgi:hypothetical protein